jgi:DegV family protein with EDD domain
MQSGVIASEGRSDIRIIDTKSVSAGQCAVVLRVARALKSNPDITMDELEAIALEAVDKVRMGFVPGDLDYLRAGGRVSNAAYLGAKILNLHPLIEIQDGKLMSTKKYRGSMARVIKQMIKEYPEVNNLEKDELIGIYGEGLEESIKREVEETAKANGFKNVWWVKTGCVIAAHSGPGAFGIVGFTK